MTQLQAAGPSPAPTSALWTPPKLLAECGRRYDMIQAAKRDRDLQADLLCLCARDVVLWVNDWCWTYDPRQPQPMLPFNTFDRQNDYLRWREDRIAARERGIAEKSRDMGVTWLNVASQVHQWLFVPGHKGTFGSRKQDLVDQLGQPDSIFEKARIILRNLPAWQMPTGFDWKKHDNFMRLMNPETDAALTGEAGKNMGRGGRSRGERRSGHQPECRHHHRDQHAPRRG
jgi:phage terminase large subunit